MVEGDTGGCRRFAAERTPEEFLIVVAPGELRAGAIRSLADVVQLGMDVRAADDRAATALPAVTVDIVDGLPGGRPFLWLDRPDAARLLVARGEMSETGARQLADILSQGAAGGSGPTPPPGGVIGPRRPAPPSGPPKPPR
ncbi:hypothetical protein ABZ721_27005 [Streptomyces sp. NPDC006733]|uniref:hypothetical protein n=1 Tax=Streptomyces sp. NPDC006733 TaxID=3155460 RepID=UPI0033E8837F